MSVGGRKDEQMASRQVNGWWIIKALILTTICAIFFIGLSHEEPSTIAVGLFILSPALLAIAVAR